MKFVALVLMIILNNHIFCQTNDIFNKSLFQKKFEGEIEVKYSNTPFDKVVFLIKDSLVLRHEFPLKNYRHGFVFQFLNYTSNKMDYYNEEKNLLVYRYMDTGILYNDINKRKKEYNDLGIDTIIASIHCHVYEFVYNTPGSNYGINNIERVYVADTNSITSSFLGLHPASIFYNPFFRGVVLKKIIYPNEHISTHPIDFEVTKISRRNIKNEEILPKQNIQSIKMNQEYGKLILTDD